MHIKDKEIFPTNISKINSDCEKQKILLMILNKEKECWHYLAVKNLPTLLRWITSKRQSYCLNCLHSFRTEKKLKSHEKVCKKRFLWSYNVIRKDNILEFNQHMMSDKTPYIVYAGMESLIKNVEDIQTIQKLIEQHNKVNIFLVDFQSQQFGYSII